MPPGSLTAMPSASVSPAQGRLVPRIRLYMEGNSRASTPITCIGRPCARATVAMPEMRPPPPIGVTNVSIAGASASISTAAVPAPAMMRGSSNGWTKVSPSRASSTRACA